MISKALLYIYMTRWLLLCRCIVGVLTNSRGFCVCDCCGNQDVPCHASLASEEVLAQPEARASRLGWAGGKVCLGLVRRWSPRSRARERGGTWGAGQCTLLPHWLADQLAW